MTDEILSAGDRRILPERWHDNGDGSYSRVVYSENGGGGGGSGPDREFLVSYFRAKNAFTGASVGDLIRSVVVYDLSGDTPTQIGTTSWFNETTQLALAGAPATADLEPALGTAGVTNAQLVAALATQTGVKITAAAALPAGGSGILGWLSNLFQGFFGVASGTADAGNPVKVGGVYQVTPTNATDGQRRDVRVGYNGAQIVSPNFGAAGVGDTTNNAGVRAVVDNGANDIVQAVGNMGFNGSTWDRLRATIRGMWVEGSVASGSADEGNPVKVAAVYNQTAINYTSGNRADLQVDSRGQLLVNTLFSATLTADATGNGLVQMQRDKLNTANVIPTAAGFYFNGTTWDRVRGNTNGSFVQGNVASAVADAGNPVKVGGVYATVAPTIANNQRGDLQLGSNGQLMVTPQGYSAAALADGYSNNTMLQNLSRTATGFLFAQGNMLFNGTTWDRARGDTTGMAVNTLKQPLVARTLAVTAVSAPLALTGAVRRISIYARGADIRYRLTNGTSTAVATDHFIAAGERLDLNCEVGATPWITAISDAAGPSTTGSLEISELS